MGAHNIRELAAFRLCEALMNAVVAAASTGKVATDRRFCDQLNDAALDATSDVAEGWVRYYPGEFGRFLTTRCPRWKKRACGLKAVTSEAINASTTSDLLQHVARAAKAARGLRAYLWTVKRQDVPPRRERPRPDIPYRRSRPRGRQDANDPS